MDSAKQPPPPVVSMDSPPPSSSKRPCPSQTENPSLQCPSHVELASHLSPTHIKTHHFLHFTPQRDHQQHIILNRKPKHQQLFYDSNPIKLHKLNMTLSSKTPCMVEEEEEVLQEQQQNNRAASSSSLHGSVSVIGRRRRMEDAVKVIPGFMGCYDFFAVFDGHGGATVANACRDRMHLLVAEEVKMLRENDEKRGFDFWCEAMSSSFLRMDREVGGGGGGCDGDLVGSMAAAVVVGEDEVVVANCGDSRTVLCHGGVAIPLSTYHKPNRPDEIERVEKAGGKVINWNGGDRVLGILATSRSIGDHSMKPFVVCEPEVKVYERREKDEFLIIASDGLWDVISNKMACEVVWRTFKMQFGASEAATMLAELAMARGSRDNISVIVVRL